MEEEELPEEEETEARTKGGERARESRAEGAASGSRRRGCGSVGGCGGTGGRGGRAGSGAQRL